MRKEYSNIFKITGITIIFSIFLNWCNLYFMRWTVDGTWNYTTKIKTFYSQEKDSIDVIGLGSSHMYCSLIPNVLWRDYSINAYVFSTQEQPIVASYYYLKEVLKTQTPKIVFLETHMFNIWDKYEYNDGLAGNAIESLKWSCNKIALINELVPAEFRQEYYIPLLKYHDKWITKDFVKPYRGQLDPYRGYVFLSEQGEAPNISAEFDTEEITVNQKDMEYIYRFIKLAKEENLELVFVNAPAEHNQRIYQSQKILEKIANENEIKYIDGNKIVDNINIDVETDFYDTGHMNVYGAEKFTKFLGRYIENNFVLEKEYSKSTKEKLNEDLEKYEEKKKSVK